MKDIITFSQMLDLQILEKHAAKMKSLLSKGLGTRVK